MGGKEKGRNKKTGRRKSKRNKATNANDAEMTVYGQAMLKQQGNSTTTIGTNIQNPHWFSWYGVNNGTNFGNCPNKTPYYNSWSARNNAEWSSATSTDNIVVKTIYDPCPVGYTVAPANAFSGMTDKKGWSSTDIGSLQQGCWFPATGGRLNDSGALNSVGTGGYYWQAVPSSTTNARQLSFTSSNASPAATPRRSQGDPVRPVEEIEKKN